LYNSSSNYGIIHSFTLQYITVHYTTLPSEYEVAFLKKDSTAERRVYHANIVIETTDIVMIQWGDTKDLYRNVFFEEK